MEERLQKIIATAGITSRRKAEEMIVQGRVSVNGNVVTELGTKADRERDHIKVDGKLLPRAGHRFAVLLNKPAGVVSTVSDPQGRETVVSLLHGIKERVYPVGRLDYHSAGLLLLTNDGDLANFLMARASAIPRTYHVKLEGRPDAKALAKLEQGITLDGRRTTPCRIRLLGQGAERSRPATAGKPHAAAKPWYEMTLVEGRYHQVRRMFERVGQAVVKLKRVRIAFLTDRGLAPGRFRFLTAEEISRLKNWKAPKPD
jgi:23S rRNA pseudouridine2605 synthase